MNVHDILYPTDFSPCAQLAFGYATELARCFGARLHLLHVIALHSDLPYDPMFYVPAADEAYARAEEETRAALSELAVSPAAVEVSSVVTVLRAADPSAAILAYEESHAIDLVVMGTHGRRGAARLLLGGHAEAVMRHSRCPVVTLRAGDVCATREVPPREILVPFDFSGSSRVALTDAAALARRCRARLRLLHVVDELPLGEVAGARAMDDLDVERAQRATQLRLRLTDVLGRLGGGVPGEVEVRIGRPADEILAAAQQPPADLIIMATRGISGVKRLLFGSVAEQVLRSASTPVLVIKPEAETPKAWTGAIAVEGVGGTASAPPAEPVSAGAGASPKRTETNA